MEDKTMMEMMKMLVDSNMQICKSIGVLTEKVDALDKKIDDVRRELHEEIQAVKKELHEEIQTEIQSLREELSAKIQTEIQSLREELIVKMEEVKKEVADFAMEEDEYDFYRQRDLCSQMNTRVCELEKKVFGEAFEQKYK